jgi:hypothetical protein
MAAYLIDHPPAQRQFRPRAAKPSGVIVVHTAESTPDWVGHDTGAENVAAFIARRSDYGSYHDLCDSDSIVNLVPYDQAAYHDGTGSNDHSYGVSAATQAHKWSEAPREWREATVRNMARAAARYARWLKTNHGIDVPARRISRPKSEARVPGFISHGERDPGRRTDPGNEFPWQDFLNYYAAEMGGAPTEEDDMTPREMLDEPINIHDPRGQKETRRVTVGELLTGLGILLANSNDPEVRAFMDKAQKSRTGK